MRIYSGLWRLEVRHNDLYHIEDEAFWGLTKFLAELDLSDNKLTDLPRTALQSLIKLRVLNFNGVHKYNQLFYATASVYKLSFIFKGTNWQTCLLKIGKDFQTL